MDIMLMWVVALIGNGVIIFCIYLDLKDFFKRIENEINSKSIKKKLKYRLKTPEELGRTFVNLGGE